MAAKRLTADAMANVINNAWLRPSWKNPYYFIKSNSQTILENWATDTANFTNSKVQSTFINQPAGGTNAHNAWKDFASTDTQFTTNNDTAIGPTMEVNYGKDISVFDLESVDIHYLKVPRRVRLTPEQVDLTEDVSQILEFPDYVCREIIKELVILILAHTNNPKLQYYAQVNNINPAPAQPEQGKK